MLFSFIKINLKLSLFFRGSQIGYPELPFVNFLKFPKPKIPDLGSLTKILLLALHLLVQVYSVDALLTHRNMTTSYSSLKSY